MIDIINIELDPKALKPYKNNARTHSDKQLAQIEASIKEFGFTNPVLVDEDNAIIAGHGRALCAIKLGMATIPARRLTGLTVAQKKALILADNKIAINSGWDNALLEIELKELQVMGFNVELTGFSGIEIGKIVTVGAVVGEDDVPEPPAAPISVLGDIIQLGRHRLMCGDATSITDIDKLMGDEKVDMVYTDPPYGISIVSKSSSKVGGAAPTSFKGTDGASKIVDAKKYSPVAGDDSIDVAVEAIHLIKTLSAKVEIIWGGNYYANHLDNSSCWIVWDKENTGNFADAELAWTNQKTAVRIFKHLWNGMSRAGDRKSEGKTRVHPTQKPVALTEWCIKEYGDDCQIILDLFGGSGSTLIGCEKAGRSCRMMEITPAYVDIIVRRWETFTGQKAINLATRLPFGEKAAA